MYAKQVQESDGRIFYVTTNPLVKTAYLICEWMMGGEVVYVFGIHTPTIYSPELASDNACEWLEGVPCDCWTRELTYSYMTEEEIWSFLDDVNKRAVERHMERF